MRYRDYRHPGMPHQAILADPARGDGHNAHGEAGDCLRTAWAGALDLHRDAVPHFARISDAIDQHGWWWEMQRWAIEHWGCNVVEVSIEKARTHLLTRYPRGGEYVVLSGPSPRGKFWHSVVGLYGSYEQIHDPHPLGLGLASVETVYALEPAEWSPPPRLVLPPGR